MMLQEALLRNAVKFEYDGMLRSEVAVAILDGEGNEVVDLRQDWLPVNIFGEEDYAERVVELMRRRYYGRDQQDKAGILRYTKVVNTIMDISDAPSPTNERELSWLLSFYWSLDQAYETLAETAAHRSEGMRPVAYQMRELQPEVRRRVGERVVVGCIGVAGPDVSGATSGVGQSLSSRGKVMSESILFVSHGAYVCCRRIWSGSLWRLSLPRRISGRNERPVFEGRRHQASVEDHGHPRR